MYIPNTEMKTIDNSYPPISSMRTKILTPEVLSAVPMQIETCKLPQLPSHIELLVISARVLLNIILEKTQVCMTSNELLTKIVKIF